MARDSETASRACVECRQPKCAYRCPRCRADYCSAKCCGVHKGKCGVAAGAESAVVADLGTENGGELVAKVNVVVSSVIGGVGVATATDEIVEKHVAPVIIGHAAEYQLTGCSRSLEREENEAQGEIDNSDGSSNKRQRTEQCSEEVDTIDISLTNNISSITEIDRANSCSGADININDQIVTSVESKTFDNEENSGNNIQEANKCDNTSESNEGSKVQSNSNIHFNNSNNSNPNPPDQLDLGLVSADTLEKLRNTPWLTSILRSTRLQGHIKSIDSKDRISDRLGQMQRLREGNKDFDEFVQKLLTEIKATAKH